MNRTSFDQDFDFDETPEGTDMTRTATIDADADDIQSLGQAAEKVFDQTSTALAERKPTHLAAPAEPGNMTPMQMAYALIQQGADLGSVKEMLAMSKELAADQARRAFDAAVADAKAEIPIIGKNATGHNSKRYADFSAYAAALRPILAKHGLSYRFRTEQTDRISVTCVLSHKDGHFEENSLSGPADASGSKNAIQAIGSTLSYLQRYTLVQALGLASGDDDDGHAGGVGERISGVHAELIRKAIVETKTDEAKFLEWLDAPSIEEIPETQLARVMNSFDAKRRRMAS